MPKPRFHVSDLSNPDVVLTEQESHHASTSRRLRPGDPVVLFDGRGTEAGGQITTVSRSGVHVRILQTWTRPRPRPTLTLAAAMPKGPRQDLLVEKCTELGIAALWPIQTARSVSQVSAHKLNKWRRTAIEAAKQSGQAWLPELSPPRQLIEALAQAHGFDRLLIAVPHAEIPSQWLTSLADAESVLAFIGPEGGWTDSERAVCVGKGCRAISLGTNTLRIETAAIALAAILHAAGCKPVDSATTDGSRPLLRC
ncbi:MAG: RsmE family RNA methyltransferase [Phycisphaerae bacterium]